MLKFLKKHIALFSLLVLLFPTIAQVHHLFEEHEHHTTLCTSTDEAHFHELENSDCLQLHIPFEVFSLGYIPFTEQHLVVFKYIEILNPTFVFSNQNFNTTNPRGPPTLFS